MQRHISGLAAAEACIVLPSQLTSEEVNGVALTPHVSGYRLYEGDARYAVCRTGFSSGTKRGVIKARKKRGGCLQISYGKR